MRLLGPLGTRPEIIKLTPIVDALGTGPMTAAALADHVGKSERAVKSHLAALEKDGALDSVKEPGRYGRRTWMLRPEAQASDEVPF